MNIEIGFIYADWIELLWLALSAYGLSISKTALDEAKGDLVFLKEQGWNGRREIMARGHLRREFLRMLVQVLFTTLGIIAILEEPHDGPRDWATIVIFFLIQSVIVYNTHSDRETSQAAVEYWKQTDLSHVAERDKEAEAITTFHATVMDALSRIEEAGEKAVLAAQKVADELVESQQRADEVNGEPGESADAASRSSKEEK